MMLMLSPYYAALISLLLLLTPLLTLPPYALSPPYATDAAADAAYAIRCHAAMLL